MLLAITPAYAKPTRASQTAPRTAVPWTQFIIHIIIH
jgi:hypothetical protein